MGEITNIFAAIQNSGFSVASNVQAIASASDGGRSHLDQEEQLKRLSLHWFDDPVVKWQIGQEGNYAG